VRPIVRRRIAACPSIRSGFAAMLFKLPDLVRKQVQHALARKEQPDDAGLQDRPQLDSSSARYCAIYVRRQLAHETVSIANAAPRALIHLMQ
jgi:hypothetical protein